MSKENAGAARELTPEQTQQPDILAIMADIRERVREDVAANSDVRPVWKPYPTDENQNSERKAGELLHSEDLRYLNSHYVYTPRLDLDAVTSHRGGPFGKLIVKFKRKVLAILWDHLLKDYFEAEKNFQSRMVRYLNDVSKYVDARDASNFWELIRKIDVDVTRALERIERINDEQMGAIRSSERRMFDTLDEALKDLQSSLEKLNTSAAQHDDKIQMLDSVARGLEGVVANLGATQASQVGESSTAERKEVLDYSYLMLENRFRGSEELIRERLKIYPPVFAGVDKAVLEIGQGRGELLDLFQEAGVPAYGVDIDAAMVERSKEKGFDAREGDGIEHLRGLPDRSIGGVVAIQVVEHLSQAQLEQLFSLCARKVVSGGRVVFETINPRSVLALSSNYFRDPTHVWPLHPDTLDYTMTLAGLRVQEVRMLSPVPEEATLRSIPVEEYMTPRWAYTVECINRNFRMLNELLYGYQDFCIVAEVP